MSKEETRKKAKDEFIAKVKELYKDKYTYKNVVYTSDRRKVCITCKEHGDFWVTPYKFLQGFECPICIKSKINEIDLNKRLLNFVEKSNQIHNNKYDYSKVNYINNHTPVTIICPIHGEFQQKPLVHLDGSGCPECGNVPRINTDFFIKKSNIIHNNKYDYSKVKYINNKTSVCIICPEHGEFWQEPKTHMAGHGCPKCADKTLGLNKFIEKAKSVHGNKYDYSKVIYTNNRTKVCIICSEHGEFWQDPSNHLGGQNCPKCNKRSSQSKFFNKLKESLDLILEFDKRMPWLGLQSLDFYNSKYNFAIEYNGIQHYEPIEFFGGEKAFLYRIELDKQKAQKCLENNCKLWIVRYDYSEDDYNKLIKEIKEYVNSKEEKVSELF